ncbi:hypothetical protein ABEB36_014267 [Hypothenemus hampei]|uniref:Uncharacterized protein n=1 Tax=Hypothenemus hampei TaxID=57062 RepID=A0ABD1E3T9_HYPHA
MPNPEKLMMHLQTTHENHTKPTPEGHELVPLTALEIQIGPAVSHQLGRNVMNPIFDYLCWVFPDIKDEKSIFGTTTL